MDSNTVETIVLQGNKVDSVSLLNFVDFRAQYSCSSTVQIKLLGLCGIRYSAVHNFQFIQCVFTALRYLKVLIVILLLHLSGMFFGGLLAFMRLFVIERFSLHAPLASGS